MLDWFSTMALTPLDEAIPKTGKTVAPLPAMIDDRPVSDFMTDRIARRLATLGGWKEDVGPEPLLDVAGFEDPAALARDLVAEFESLPWHYIFSMRLPHQLGATLRPMIDDTGRHAIGGGIYLADDRALDPHFPLPPGISPFSLLGEGHAWGVDNVYVQVPLEGYADRYGASGTARRAVETLQTFIGLGIALRLFRYDPSYSPLGFAQPAIVHQVHRVAADRDVIHDTNFGLDAGTLMGMEGFRFAEYGPDFPLAAFTKGVLGQMRICFDNPKTAERINRSAQWLATSYMTRNGTMAFVQAMVAMEILLGDKKTTDMVGIGELLSNRCAYLIGDSQADREQVLADFRGLYAVRSEIVHSGKSRLSHSEWSKYNRLLYMCGRAIMEEISLLSKNQPAA